MSTDISLFDLTPESLKAKLASWDEPAYRAGQILEWVYERGASSYEEMSNLPKALRTRLTSELGIYRSTVTRRLESDDGTIKLLLAWPWGETSECVLIPEGRRQTACVSTQVGCPVGCVFCASGLDGLESQLTTGQIVEQAMRVRTLCRQSARLSNVVFMGLGEPLANYKATIDAVRTMNAAWGMGIGARKITISTVGLPSRIHDLAEEALQVTLAISLHATTDKLRRELIPWAKRVTIDTLIEAAIYYFDRTGREVTLEYILLADVNDSVDDAHALSGIARRMRGTVNLIPYNPVKGLEYRRPSDETVSKFASTLRRRAINVQIRTSRGLDVDAACGQLRRRDAQSKTSRSKG